LQFDAGMYWITLGATLRETLWPLASFLKDQ